MKAEGGYVNDPQDPGGETYKGIARTRNAKWPGWVMVDQAKTKPNFPKSLDNNADLQQKVRDFYEANYWDKVRGDEITDQHIADSIFDFAVNAGPATSIKLAQITVGVEPNGVVDAETLQKINADNARAFLAVFSLSKISRYVHICEGRKESRKYFYGWVKRTLEGL